MALPTIADVKRVALEWTQTGGAKAATNVLHFNFAGDPQDLFDILDAHVTASMWACVSDTANVNTVAITPLDGTSGAQVFPTPTAAAKWAGSSSSEFIPQGSGLVSLYTGLRGPANRGRVYLPYLGESAQVNGQLTGFASITTAWQNFYIACLADLAVLGVASYKHSVWHAAIAYTGRTRTATQRRRQRRT